MKRTIYATLGWLAVAMGIAGALLPGLPTTVFLLIALFFFSRSSPRFEAWLLAHPKFGASLRRFRESGGMTRSIKRAALCSMWTAITVSATLLVVASPKVALATVALGLIGTLTIVYLIRTVPDAPKTADAPASSGN